MSVPGDFKPTPRIHLYEGSQTDLEFLSCVANEVAPHGFDIIIDDASHLDEASKATFWHLFDQHLKPGGLYVIEDWGTGYWDDWPDGRCLDVGTYSYPDRKAGTLWDRITRRREEKVPMGCHSYGMVDFIKQLVDEQGVSDVTRRSVKGRPERRSKFDNMLITPSIVFVRKAQCTSR